MPNRLSAAPAEALPRQVFAEINARLPVRPSSTPSPAHQAALDKATEQLRRHALNIGRLCLKARGAPNAHLRRYHLFVANIELTRATALADSLAGPVQPLTTAGRPGHGEVSGQVLWDGARMHGLDVLELDEQFTGDGAVRMVIAHCVERRTGRPYQLTAAAIDEG